MFYYPMGNFIPCWIVIKSSATVCLYSDCMEKKRCNGSITIRWKKDLKKEYTRR